MKRRQSVHFLTAAALAALLPLSQARAEDTKGKWQFGFGLTYFSTTDYIRSNADLAFASGLAGPDGLPGVGYVDERPDGNILNEPTVADDFRLHLNGSYGLTRWLALEVLTSYQKSQVGNIEYYSADYSLPFAGDGTPDTSTAYCGPDPINGKACYRYNTGLAEKLESNSFVSVGQLTTAPIQFSGLVRFRPESPLDPYIGLGLGYIYTNLEYSAEFSKRSDVIDNLHVISASEGEFTDSTSDKSAPSPGFKPAPLQAVVANTFEWHAITGIDYYVSNRFSFYFDARYVWTSGQVNITTDGAHQVRFAIEDKGRLIEKTVGSIENPYLWEDVGLHNSSGIYLPCDPGTPCLDGRIAKGDGLFATEDKNLNGSLDGGEDNGLILVLPAGAILDAGEPLDTFTCVACIGNGTENDPTGRSRPDTEDLNYNFYMDRFVKYGYDICTTSEGLGNPKCAGVSVITDPNRVAYVWPGGCPTSGPSSIVWTPPAEGCPAIPATTSSAVSTTQVDDVADVMLIQGGTIRLGGFGLGFGFKFTF